MFHFHFGKLFIVVVIFYEINGDYEATFRCNSGEFILASYFCDSGYDCADKSDEGYGCSMETCGDGKFLCESGECISVLGRCNTLLECSDGSDEFNCDHELSVENCTIQKGKFLCEDGLRCLRWNETCSGEANCFDGSDENDNCFEYDTDICNRCPHPCFRSPKGPRCFYNFNNDTARSSYESIEECNVYKNECSQKCIMYQKVTQCSCSEHYHAAGFGNIDCHSNVPYGLVIIYSSPKSIVFFNITLGRDFVVQDDVVATALTAAHNYAYWSVMSNNHASIFKKSLESNDTDELIFGSNEETLVESVFNHDSAITSPITSISIDWMTSNVYFTSLKWLSVCSENIRLCTHLKNSTSGIESVALAPRYGFMFWVQNAKAGDFEARIFKSAMDGSDEHVLINDRLGFSNSLVVDESSEKLYWLHVQLDRIESIRMNGRGRKIERLEPRSFISYAEFEGLLYWTLEFNNHIFADKSENNVLLTENFEVKLLYVYNPLLQRTKISNPCLKSSCKGLCLMRPSLTKELDYTCVCEHSQPSNDIGSPRWCDSSRESRGTIEIKESSVTRNVFIVIFVIALLCLGFFFFFNKWRESKKSDSIKLVFNRKEENNDDL